MLPKVKSFIIFISLLVAALFIPSSQSASAQIPIPSIGTAENFALLAGNAFSVEPALSIIGAPGAFVGESPGITINQAARTFLDANTAISQLGTLIAEKAATDTKDAFVQFTGLTTTIRSGEVGAGSGGVNVILPGIYESGNTTTNIADNSAITASTDVILDAQGDADAKFVFISRGGMITSAGISVVLRNGANPSNIFWIITADFTTGAGTILSGTVIAQSAATLGAATLLTGRVLCLENAPLSIGDGTVITALISQSESERLASIAAQVELDRLAALAAQVEAARIAALAAQEEANRLAAIAAQVEAARLAAIAAQVESDRLSELAARAEASRLSAIAAQVEAIRLSALAAQIEAERLAALAIKGEIDRTTALAAQLEANRLTALATKAESDRLALLAAKVAADRLAAEKNVKKEVEATLAIKGELFIKPVGSVYFATGSATLTEASKKVLSLLTSKLAEAKVTRIALFGYTDAQGANYDNKALSIRRANAVALYIRSKGISTLLRSTGKGILLIKGAARNNATSRRVDVLTR